jgi:hypothetical protein
MSLVRLVYYSAIVGGWAAFLGWLLAECVFVRGNGDFGTTTVVLVGLIVGAAIGAGLNIVAGMANAQLKNLVMRAPAGMIGGGIGGAVGILVGQLIYVFGLPRALGFMFLGLGVGVVEGVYERSPNKIRNGAIGGIVGGLAGGFLFDPISAALMSSSGIASRAAAFVILGLCIGAMIGIVQVILKEASLRVLDGYGVGREIVLGDAVTVIGRGDHLRLPFLGRPNADLDVEHFRILRQGNGNFVIEDNHSKLGVSVRSEGANNYDSVRQPRELRDGDVIRFGVNLVRFSQRKKKGHDAGTPAVVSGSASPVATSPAAPAPPPPPPRKSKQAFPAVQAPAPQPSQAEPVPVASPAPVPLSATAPVAPAPKISQPATAPKPFSSVPPPPPPPPRKKKP